MLVELFVVFFLLLLTGFFCKKLGFFTDAAINSINKFIIFVGFPTLIIGRTAALDMEGRIFINFLLALFISFGIMFLYVLYAKLYCRGKRFPAEDKALYEFAMMAPNNGFMGLPIAFTFFGDLGLLYMIGANTALNIFFFTFGIKMMDRNKVKTVKSVKENIISGIKTIAHPGICAAIAGIVICYSGVELPGIAKGYLDIVGAVATPLAMVSIGTMLADGFGPGSFKKRLVMENALNKNFIIPLIAAVIVWFLPLDPLVKTIIIVSNTMPVATMVAIFSEQYGRNKTAAVEMLVVSTLISMATIPTAIWVLHSLGL